MLEINGVSFSYAGRQTTKAIEDISFSVNKGSFVSVIGPSGCGKTTLASLIVGHLSPQRGDIRADGRLVTGPGRERFLINQENDLFEWMTLRENIQFVTRRDFREYLRLVHLDGHENKYPHELSGGMKKRASIARALAANAEYLVIDEAFASLDCQLKEALYEELLKIWTVTNKTILLVTHDINEALYLSDTVVVLTQSPSRVKRIIPVPFPRPRRPAIRYTGGYVALEKMIHAMVDGYHEPLDEPGLRGAEQ